MRYMNGPKTKDALTSLAIEKMVQIKITVRYYFTSTWMARTKKDNKCWHGRNPPVKMAIIKKSTNNKCSRGCGEKGTLLHCWWECKLVQPLWRAVKRFLKKLKIELPYGPAIPLLDINPEKNMIWKDACSPMFIVAQFTITKTWKQPKSPLKGEWIKKMWYVHTMEYYAAIKKNEAMSFAATWIDPEIIILSEVNQRRRNMTSLMCGI